MNQLHIWLILIKINSQELFALNIFNEINEMEEVLKYLTEEREQQWRIEIRSRIKTKERTLIERVKMNEEAPDFRNKNAVEVNRGLTMEQAVKESQRCIDCANPTCITGCPVNINIPKFLKKIEAGDILGAASVLKETNTLPAVCGRVCPQEKQCEAQCFYTLKLKKEPVAIGYLERFAADFEQKSGKMSIPEVAQSNNIKVAAIGSGPASLAWASDMARFGYDVTVFEALHEIGGVLKYGIPEFRLPNSVVDIEIDSMRKMGVKFITNFIVGKTSSFEDLRQKGFEAFFVGSGAGLPRFMNIPGENYIGIFSSNEYLTRVNLMNAANPEYDTPVISGKNVAVIGGGNTAMDAVRTAKRLGAENARIIYRRSINEMPARIEEIKHAQEEGIEFLNLNNPLEYYADENGRVKSMKVQKMELGEPDSSGRRSPVPVEGSEYFLDTDTVVVSVGVSPNPLIPAVLKDLKVSRWGTIIVNEENMQSSIPDIFAGGDIVRGGATVILAMGDGRKAAAGMHRFISEKIIK
jgi:glutamate synthase (NADPH/NADH) small chain